MDSASSPPGDKEAASSSFQKTTRKTSVGSDRSVRFSDAVLESEFSTMGHSLEPIPSVASSLEKETFVEEKQLMQSIPEDSCSGTAHGKAAADDSSAREKFYGSRHLSLMKPAKQQSGSLKIMSENSMRHSFVEEAEESEPVSPLTMPNPPPFSATRGRNRSQSTPPQYIRTNSESPIPSAFKRIGSFAADGTRRKRRPTVSQAGAAVIGGVTEVVPHPGVMAAAFASVAVAPSPTEVILRKSTVGDVSLVSSTASTSEIKVMPRHTKILVATYLKHAWGFVTTIKGFFITVYLCLVIAFGGMLFLILIGAAPAMNRHDSPTSSDTPGKRWIEIDSQVLNALFCVTGFGLMPQRTKHLYFLIKGQIKGTEATDRQLMKRYIWYVPGRNWAQLAAVLYLYELNSIFQIVMAAGMWAYNRHNRPAWLTGMTMGLGFGSSIIGGIIAGIEERKIRKEAKAMGEDPELGRVESEEEIVLPSTKEEETPGK